MCYRTKLNTKLSDIERTLEARFIEPDAYKPQQEINAFTFSKTPVISDENQGEIQMFNWGLIPFWAKDDKIKKMTLNAKIETISEKPSFRNSVKKRCLIIADGYYEWQWKDPKGKDKQKYLITPTDQEIFAFAGIYNNKKRMPVVLKQKDHQAWLNGQDHSNFAFPYEVPLIATEVA